MHLEHDVRVEVLSSHGEPSFLKQYDFCKISPQQYRFTIYVALNHLRVVEWSGSDGPGGEDLLAAPELLRRVVGAAGPRPERELLVGRAVAVEDLHVVQHVLQAGGLDRLVLHSKKDKWNL